MADQLILGLDAALPRVGGVTPMWPVPRRDVFDSADHLFEPSWGGHRVLAMLEPGGRLRIVDAHGVDLASRLPELAGLRRRVAAGSTVLDGELVAVDGRGRPDPAALRERIAGRAGRPLAMLAFDLLHRDGIWLLDRPLDARRALLRRVAEDGDALLVVPAVVGDGRALYAAVSAQGAAGVLARVRSSPYLPGVRSRLWRSIAVRAPDTEHDARGPDAAPDDAPEVEAESPRATAGPLLALFRRLPLGGDD